MEIDNDEYVERIEMCMEKLHSYRDKVENEFEKFASAIIESESEMFETIREADVETCKEALGCYLDLKRLKGMLLKSQDASVKSEAVGVKVYIEQVALMQHQMQYFMREQTKQQVECIDRHEPKGKDVSSVKLLKLDIVTFDRNKLKWQ